ncbi:MAG TPA: YciI family protein [Candidatus Binatia bacterium]|nr:YciI family protein [Candidatus Binatia bacterium]
MGEFLYLFRGGEPAGSPAQMQQHMQKWVVWIKELSDTGHIKAPGHPLERTGKLVKGKEKLVTDGPYAEAKDLVGGYLLVEAKDLDHAAELARGCPIFETGGLVEVRPIMQMNL